MRGVNKNKILQEITKFYLKSSDFNGIPSTELSLRLSVRFSGLLALLTELISEGKVGILYSSPFINPYIIGLGFESESEQIKRLVNPETRNICLYPRSLHLHEVVNLSHYSDKPYALELALGSPQLAHHSFDLSILENYRNDPRYTYMASDFIGHICYHSDQMSERDQVMLERFGFSYDSGLNRAVAVCLRYLSGLSPEHQQMWKSKELEGKYWLHPVYHDNFLGKFRSEVPLSIFDAFIAELHLICQMTAQMGRPPLFREDYGEYGENKPQKFSFLVRPTLEEFNSFVHLLDKMISENINKKFFQKEVPYETERERKDGKIEIRTKGTLQILDEWIRTFVYPPNGWISWDDAVQTFREIRKKRQDPAHTVHENNFEPEYFKDQRDLTIRAYEGMKTLRMMLKNHPEIRNLDIDIPDYLRDAKVWRG